MSSLGTTVPWCRPREKRRRVLPPHPRCATCQTGGCDSSRYSSSLKPLPCSPLQASYSPGEAWGRLGSVQDVEACVCGGVRLLSRLPMPCDFGNEAHQRPLLQRATQRNHRLRGSCRAGAPPCCISENQLCYYCNKCSSLCQSHRPLLLRRSLPVMWVPHGHSRGWDLPALLPSIVEG